MEDGASPLYGLILFVFFVVVDFILYGFVGAMEYINEAETENLADSEQKKAQQLVKYLEDKDRYLHTAQIITTVLAAATGVMVFTCFPWNVIEKSLGLAGGIFLLIFLGIFFPQKITRRNADVWAFRLVDIVHGIEVFVTPIRFLADGLSNLLGKLGRVDVKSEIDDVTEQEIISMVNEGHEQGVIQASEAEMIHNIFDFDDKEAKDIMTHRKNIVAVDGEMTLGEAMDFMLDGNNSRFPVYEEDIDNLIGILHIKDAMSACQQEGLKSRRVKDLKEILRTVDVIPETRNINVLFHEMQKKKIHMVVVVDEYGQTAGLVAMEDILEEIVGEILDEYDEDETYITQNKDGSFLMDGMADLEEVGEVLAISFEEEEEEYDTLNGFLISKFDKIPGENEVFEVQAYGYLFQVLSVENKMVETVRVTRLNIQELPKYEESSCQDLERMVE